MALCVDREAAVVHAGTVSRGACLRQCLSSPCLSSPYLFLEMRAPPPSLSSIVERSSRVRAKRGAPGRQGGLATVRRFVAGVVVAGLVAILPHAAVAQERATAGDPIDLFTGLHSRESDDIVLDGSPPIRLRRSYRNGDPVSRAFGIGTSHSYNLFLFSDSASLAYVDLILEDGARIHYVRTSPGSG